MNDRKITHAKIQFDERSVPIALDFDDPYFSFKDGLAESEYVFLEGNQLAARLCDGFHIAELGFGTGLNFLLTWRLWQSLNRPGQLKFTSFEAFPIRPEDRRLALSGFDQLEPWLDRFEQGFDGQFFHDDQIDLQVIHGDARHELPIWKNTAHAWFLDGFSPAKNPELWQADLLQAVANHTHKGGSFATYTAAGAVRRGLEAAGFQVERIAGFAHKRHMLRGVYGDGRAGGV